MPYEMKIHFRSYIYYPIRLQLFDFKVNIDADKWASIFNIEWKLPRLKWNDLCVIII